MENQTPRLESVHIVENNSDSQSAKKFKFRISISPKIKSLFVLVVGVTLSILVLVVGFNLVNRYLLNGSNESVPVSSPTPVSQGINYVPSPYADDEKVLDIELRVMNLENELELVDFREETLQPPVLDWNIDFF